MSKHFDSLDETFDVETEVLKPIKRKKDALIVSDKSEDKEKDYQTARAQLHNIVDKMQEALDGALEVAQESDHPRAYEVVFAGAKHTADVVDKLADLQKKMRDLDKVEEVKVQQTNTQNNIYMQGTTEDIMRMIKEGNKDK
jgi:hypothetical protein